VGVIQNLHASKEYPLFLPEIFYSVISKNGIYWHQKLTIETIQAHRLPLFSPFPLEGEREGVRGQYQRI
jgi:hypothetical protein